MKIYYLISKIKRNPMRVVYKDLLAFLNKIQNIKTFSKHEKNLKINKEFIREKFSSFSFNKL